MILDSQIQKIKLPTSHTTHNTLTQKGLNDIKAEILNRKKHRYNAPRHRLQRCIWGLDSNSEENKSKNKQMELQQTKKLLHSKRNLSLRIMKKPTEWGKILKIYIYHDGLISRYQSLISKVLFTENSCSSQNANINPIRKWAEEQLGT